MTFGEQVRELVENYLGAAAGLFEVFFEDVSALVLFITNSLFRLVGGPF